MQISPSWIWTQVAEHIFYDDNRYTMKASKLKYTKMTASPQRAKTPYPTNIQDMTLNNLMVKFQ